MNQSIRRRLLAMSLLLLSAIVATAAERVIRVSQQGVRLDNVRFYFLGNLVRPQ